MTNLGDARIGIYVIDFIFIIAMAEISGYFINKARRKPERRISLLFGVTFLIMAATMLLKWVNILYLPDGTPNIILEKSYAIGLAMSIAIFCYSIENEYNSQLKTKRLLTSITFIFAIFIIIFPNDPNQGLYYQLFEIVFYFMQLMYLVPFYFIFILSKNNTGPIRTRILLAGLGYLIVMFGEGGTQKRMIAMWDEIYSGQEIAVFLFIFKLIMCVGLFLIFMGFRTEVYLETNWQSELLEQYIVHKGSRQCIYSKRFGDSRQDSQEDVVEMNQKGEKYVDKTEAERNLSLETQIDRKKPDIFEFGIKLDSVDTGEPEELRVRYEIENSSLFSSGVMGILDTIRDVTAQRNPQNEQKPLIYKKTVKKKIITVDKGRLKFLFMESQNIVNVFIVKSDLSILRFFLRRFTEEFENYFGVLLNTNSVKALEKTNVYASMEYITSKVFSQYRVTHRAKGQIGRDKTD